MYTKVIKNSKHYIKFINWTLTGTKEKITPDDEDSFIHSLVFSP
jgi:hypothetical protein